LSSGIDLESPDAAGNPYTSGGPGSDTFLGPSTGLAVSDGGVEYDTDLESDGGEGGQMPRALAWSSTRLTLNISTSSGHWKFSVRTSQACLSK